VPAVNLAVVKEADRLGGLGLAGELDEREPPRASGLPISGKVDLDDAAGLGQELPEGVRGGPQAQVADEDSGWNG
jgi:hypothetical protein